MPEYHDGHPAPAPLMPNPQVPCSRFSDGGLNRTSMRVQPQPETGEIGALDAVMLPGQGMRQLIEQLVRLAQLACGWRGYSELPSPLSRTTTWPRV
jgi:hypothetical protein